MESETSTLIDQLSYSLNRLETMQSTAMRDLLNTLKHIEQSLEGIAQAIDQHP